MKIIMQCEAVDLLGGKIVEVDEVDVNGDEILKIVVEQTVKKKKIQSVMLIRDAHFVDEVDVDRFSLKDKAALGFLDAEEEQELQTYLKLAEKFGNPDNYQEGMREPDDV